MKILYGVQGTGNGHIARARIMAEAFAKHDDIKVDFVFSGRAPEGYFDMQVFGQYKCLKGLSFVSSNGKIDHWATLTRADLRRLYYDIQDFDISGYDLLINDFEPVTAWAARKQGLPSLSISHQASFLYPEVPTAEYKLTDKLIMQKFAPTDAQLGVHWYHFDCPILPPFVVESPLDNPSHENILVYLPFESLSAIQQLLEPLSDQRFVCFHSAITEPYRKDNVSWHPISKPKFREALLNSAGVIGNGGFELSSEALKLGKKLLIKPLHGQFEQYSNVKMLTDLGLCSPMFQLDTDTVEEWLFSSENEAISFPDDPAILIDWIKAGDFSNPLALCQRVWQQVKFGSKTQERLIKLAI